MKITVLQENLKTALGSLQRAIPSKPQLPILSSVRIEVTGNSLILAATDLYLGVRSTIPAQVQKEGVLVVPGEIFKNLIFSLSAGEVSLEKKDASLVIRYGNSTSSLPYQAAEEYPQFPEVGGTRYSLSSELLQRIESQVSFAAAIDATRPILASLLFSFKKEGLSVVGTDGFRLAILHTGEAVDGLEEEILIPVKAMSEVFRMVSQAQSKTVEFLFSRELKQVLFVVDGVEIYIRLIDGEYPPYQKIIPPEFSYSLSLDWEEFATQVKRALLFSRDSSNIVRLQIEKDVMRVNASSPAQGEYQGEVALTNSGENTEIAFNALYLLDFLNMHKEGELIFLMNESLKPAALKIQNVDDYTYIVMPFRAVS